MKIYELTARYDSRKSFYGKAKVIEHDDGIIQLQSYDTIVCEIDKDGYFWHTWNGESRTTNRHIKEFKKQFSEVIR
jgi:hypothetical protein